MKRLENEMSPLKENVKSLTAQKDMLVGEKTGLRSEVRLANYIFEIVILSSVGRTYCITHRNLFLFFDS